jgi:hypothetical protein
MLMFALTALLLAVYVLFMLKSVDVEFIKFLLMGSFSATIALLTGRKHSTNETNIEKANIEVDN